MNTQEFFVSPPMETELRQRTFRPTKTKYHGYLENSTYLTKFPLAHEHSYKHILRTNCPIMTPTTSTTTSKPETILTHSHNNCDVPMARRFSESSADEFQRNDESHKGARWNKNMWRKELLLNSIDRTTHKFHKPNGYCPRYHNDDDDESGTEDGCCCYSLGRRRNRLSDVFDVGIRVLLVFIFICLETTKPFKRKIHPEEMWLYKNPRTPDIVSAQTLLISVIFGPLIVTMFHLWLTGDRRDFRAATWVWTLALGLNGVTTGLLKITVGRHRPDFFYRCFPDGIEVLNNVTSGGDIYNCTGDIQQICEGRKSFPSGHASFSFVGFGFIAIFVVSKLHAFSARGRGQSWRICVSAMPMLLAVLIAISRTCDYHHHWEDVLTGSVIGLSITYLVYRQYYPPLSSKNCHRPYLRACHRLHGLTKQLNQNQRSTVYERLSSTEDINNDDDELVSYQNHGDSSKNEHQRLI